MDQNPRGPRQRAGAMLMFGLLLLVIAAVALFAWREAPWGPSPRAAAPIAPAGP